MVLAMIEKKDPAQKIVADWFSNDDPIDDDPIIELTDEITVNPEEDRKPVSPETGDFIPPKVDKENPSFEDDEGMIVFEENANSSMLEYESDGEEIDFFTDDEERDVENDIIAMPSESSSTFGKDDKGIDMLAEPCEFGAEYVSLERFCQEVGSTRLNGLQDLFLIRPHGYHDNGNLATLGTDRPNDFHSALSRHLPIDDDQVELILLEEVQRFLAVVSLGDF
jgi:hypothetical protein